MVDFGKHNKDIKKIEKDLAFFTKNNSNLAPYGNKLRSCRNKCAQLRKRVESEEEGFHSNSQSVAEKLKVIEDMEAQVSKFEKAYEVQLEEQKRNAVSNVDASIDILGVQKQLMKDQDEQLEGIGKGVSNLHSYSMAMKDESEMHVRLLNDIDDDVKIANQGLENEARRAEKASKQMSICKLYLIILGLVILLLFLMIVGGSS